MNTAIASAQGYLDGLYKPLPDGQSVQSEDYGLPLRVYFPEYRQWVLLGQGRAGDCIPQCTGASSITPVTASTTTEAYAVSFSSPSKSDALRVTVSLDWAYRPGQFSITLSTPQLNDRSTSAQLWLDDVPLATYSSGSPAVSMTRSFPTAE